MQRLCPVVVVLAGALASAVFGVEPRLTPGPESPWTEAQRGVRLEEKAEHLPSSLR